MGIEAKENAIATSDSDKKLMAELGITSMTKVVFYFGGHTYERLADAVNYAQKQHSAPRLQNERRGDAKADPKV